MPSYKEEQHKIFEKLEEEFRKGKKIASLVEFRNDYINDNQICLTSVVFLPSNLQEIITEKVINPLRGIGDSQYYYVPNSFHVTIKNIKTISDPPLFNEDDIKKARSVFSKVISQHKSFQFDLRGILETPTGLSVRAYSDSVLRDLVMNLDNEMKKIGLFDDKKYISDSIFFGNVTFCRYTKKPNKDFINKVKELKKVEIGTFSIKTVSLITTNSVCHPQKTKIIANYKLKN